MSQVPGQSGDKNNGRGEIISERLKVRRNEQERQT